MVYAEHRESSQVASLPPGRNGSVASPLASGASTWLYEGVSMTGLAFGKGEVKSFPAWIASKDCQTWGGDV